MTQPPTAADDEQPGWLVDAVEQLVGSVVVAAGSLPRHATYGAFLGAVRDFDDQLLSHYHHPAHPEVPNAYWLLAAGLAGGAVSVARMIDPTWCGPDVGGAAIVMRDGRTGEVVYDPDAAVTTVDQRAALAAARIVTAAANDDRDTAMAVFAAAMNADGRPAVAAMVTALAAILDDTARNLLPVTVAGDPS